MQELSTPKKAALAEGMGTNPQTMHRAPNPMPVPLFFNPARSVPLWMGRNQHQPTSFCSSSYCRASSSLSSSGSCTSAIMR